MNAESDPVVLKVCANPAVAASFEEFAELDSEAAEMEIAPLDPEVKRTAKRILTALAQEFPRYYMVAPDDDGEITIQTNARSRKQSSVLIVCEQQRVLCFVVIDGKSRHAEYGRDSVPDLPDEFIRTAMRELD